MNVQTLTNESLNTGLTQKELADEIGCSQALIFAYSKGLRGKRPSADIYLKLVSFHKKVMRSQKKQCFRNILIFFT